jgi:N,N'-diacetyllegionaminate synthase
MSRKSDVMIIAEAGVNHNGNLDLARKLIDVAAEAGADVVKFQTFKADSLVTRDAKKANYQIKPDHADESQYAMLKRLELSTEAHHELIAHCALRDIRFLSSPFDIKSVDFLRSIGQQLFKIPSSEITNYPYLLHIGKMGGEVILSTGMSTLEDIEAALSLLESNGTPRHKISILHCTTEYPVPMNEVNLKAMQTIANAFGTRVGYSDHTSGIEVAIAAVAMGASIVEKHFTLDKTLPGPDHRASLEPIELGAMISSIRNIENALGDGIKRLTPSEEINKRVTQKSIVAKALIKSGEIFSNQNLDSKRPADGISPMRWEEVIGRKAKRDFAPDDRIEL